MIYTEVELPSSSNFYKTWYCYNFFVLLFYYWYIIPLIYFLWFPGWKVCVLSGSGNSEAALSYNNVRHRWSINAQYRKHYHMLGINRLILFTNSSFVTVDKSSISNTNILYWETNLFSSSLLTFPEQILESWYFFFLNLICNKDCFICKLNALIDSYCDACA